MDYQNHIKAIEFALEGKNEEIKKLLRDCEDDRHQSQIELAIYLYEVLYGENDIGGADLKELIDNIDDNELKVIGVLTFSLRIAQVFKQGDTWMANNYLKKLREFQTQVKSHLEVLGEKKNVIDDLINFIDANSGDDGPSNPPPIEL